MCAVCIEQLKISKPGKENAMPNIDLIIRQRTASIGSFMVGRILPYRLKRLVGPFIYIDHMGPVKLNGQQNLDVLPHPHIGLSTLTYLFEGAIMHRDSMGFVREIQPGAVNWMNAGKGVVHSERTPDYLRNTAKSLHGLQIWVALPKELEQTEPSFTHIAAAEIPSWKLNDVIFKLIAGEAFGKKSPVPVFSRLYFIEIKSLTTQKINLDNGLYGECGLYILEGNVTNDENTYTRGQMLVVRDCVGFEFEMAAKTTICLFGGEPFPEERFIDWNFVSSDKEKLKQAKDNWIQRRFLHVPGETEFIPYPDFKK